MTDRTLRTSTLPWKRETIWGCENYLERSPSTQTASLFNRNVLIVETHIIHVALPLPTGNNTICSSEHNLCVLALCMVLCVLAKIVHHINTHTPQGHTHTEAFRLYSTGRQFTCKGLYIILLKM